MVDCSLSGVTLASLLHSAMEQDEDSEGLLLGCAAHETQRAVDDFGEGDKSKVVLDIQRYVVTGGPMSFYGPSGSIDETHLRNILDSHQKSDMIVLGWFRFRRNTPLRPSAREIRVTEELERWSKAQRSAGDDRTTPFLVGLLTSSADALGSTHTYEFRFLRAPNLSPAQTCRSMAIVNAEGSR